MVVIVIQVPFKLGRTSDEHEIARRRTVSRLRHRENRPTCTDICQDLKFESLNFSVTVPDHINCSG